MNVKNGNPINVKEMLIGNRYLVFDFDYVWFKIILKFCQTALHWAAKRGFLRIAEILLQCGADPDALDIVSFTLISR